MDAVLSNPRRNAFLIALAACLAFCLVSALRLTGGLERFELIHHDKVTSRVALVEPAPDVVLVTVEEQDLATWGWPLPDAKIAEILLAIDRSDPAAIGLDIYRDSSVGIGADALTKAFDETSAIAISKLGPEGGLTVNPPEAVRATGNFGFSDIPIDRDGVVRRALLLVSDRDGVHLSFALKLVMQKLGLEGITPAPDDPTVMMLGANPLPPIGSGFGGYTRVDAAGYQVPLAFGHALPVAQTFAAREILQSGPTDDLKGKVVIVGLNSESIKDYFLTPLNNRIGPRFTFGSQIHASAVQSLLDVASGRERLLRDIPKTAQYLLILLAAGFGAVLGRITRSGMALLVVVPSLLLIMAGGMNHLLNRGLWLPMVPTLLALALGFLFSFGPLAILARRQRKIMATLFSDHLSPDLAAQIWQNRALFMSGGKPRPQHLEATILFLDIAGSTAIGGKTDPARFVGWMSRALDALSDVARAHGGFIEKFTGDGLLIAFGAPLQRNTPDEICADALAACRCAWALGQQVTALNAETGEEPAYKVRIGLHSGTVYGGVLGNRGTMQYNLVGDTVNMAARIEAYGKILQDRQSDDALICMSGATLTRSGQSVSAEPVGTLLHDDGSTRIEIFQMRAVD